jgi:hypothetical protein
MNKWIISFIFDDDDGLELFSCDYGSVPIPNIGEKIWPIGKFSGNGYLVIDKDIAYDKAKIIIVVKSND